MADTTERRTFKVHACIGRGGYGEVYRATMFSEGISHEVALKVLHANLDQASQPVQRLRDEMRFLEALDHPSILTVHDLVVIEGRIGLVTEWIEGQDLSKCIRGSDRISTRAAVEALGRIAGALEFAHNAPVTGQKTLGLVHRDVKPANIRVGRNGQVRLLDFGVARADNIEREAKTIAGNIFGSHPYMAPERFRTSHSAPAADVYALGATLYEALKGERLWLMPLGDIFKLVVSETRYRNALKARLAELPPTPEPVVELIENMLSWDASARPSALGVQLRCDKLRGTLSGADLFHWCRDRTWPELLILPGLFSGRVVHEDAIDPLEADNIGREVSWGTNDQDMTVHIRLKPAKTILVTPPPAPPKQGPGPPRTQAQSEPVSRTGGVRLVRILVALVGLFAALGLVFLLTFAVMLYLLQRLGG